MIFPKKISTESLQFIASPSVSRFPDLSMADDRTDTASRLHFDFKYFDQVNYFNFRFFDRVVYQNTL